MCLRERAVRHVEITFKSPVDPAPFSALAGVRVRDADGRILRLSAPEAAMDGVVKAAARQSLVDFVSAPAELEEIFMDLYRETADGG